MLPGIARGGWATTNCFLRGGQATRDRRRARRHHDIPTCACRMSHVGSACRLSHVACPKTPIPPPAPLAPRGRSKLRPSPNNKGRGIAAAPLVRAIGFRLWLILQPLSSEPAWPRIPQRPCRTSWCRLSQARTARRLCRRQTQHPSSQQPPHSAYRPS